MASIYNFKKIQVVPKADEFLDIVLSKTQRKTPTVIHKNYKISRIRNFYMRKVKFTQDNFEEKLKQMLDDFPRLENVHPFYADLMNVLYDKDHYKLALGQINTARHLISQVAKDYVRLMKFGDSLYRCKQLKRAALGRMATIMKRQKDSLAYLEQVRQHLARLPSIDPNTRTLLVCGYPNVGKSSFMNKVTRAEVDVQPYAFTTKSLFVGHMDYRYLRWQVIDTPGILDHPLEDRNTIEMQSITAMAHLRACILYFMDLSEQCGYSVSAQVQLYHSIKPLFANKPIVLILSKMDARRPEDLSPEEMALLETITKEEDVQVARLSCHTEEGVMEARNMACDKLLQARVEVKMKGQKINDVLNKLHLTQPQTRDDKERPAFIPGGAMERLNYDWNDPNRRRLERDLEAEEGGAGVYSYNLKKNYMLADEEWKEDIIPEIWEGKNIADFIDPDIAEKLEQLEREEEQLEKEGTYDSEEEILDSEEEEIRQTAEEIREKKKLMAMEARSRGSKARTALPKKAGVISEKKMSELEEHLGELGLDAVQAHARSRKRERSETRGESIARGVFASTTENAGMARELNATEMRNVRQKLASNHVLKQAQRKNNLMAKRGEADREILVKKPKHLFAGKRKQGSHDRR
ncbi:P-loop containing nucleoside triphosphate hydrolase protein [Syncephalis pseudoplumigaleata]|uniref:Nucleolar GTP-binding protein 1 n=1 Tax=Syncephalis pseudoplumigaleata TaxID=1712513 RepID=A0A4P9YYY0_9FUNG|nr:P-loop containing nucleoside triphosphate hydrolase protein [Syncephalis pseudoplumigaleata]|eukprot:RKP24230.1 P-loop containing nucleoside triphosphate hydrolase protein [Syncephalis pseudoplumigaleata]